MTWLRRIIVGGFMLISLLLCAMACVLWGRSYWVLESISRKGTGHAIVIMSYAGGLTYNSIAEQQPGPYVSIEIPAERRHWLYGKWDAPSSSPLDSGFPGFADPGVRHDWLFAGFRWRVSDGTVTVPAPRIQSLSSSSMMVEFLPSRRLTLPYWFIATIFGIGPIGRLFVSIRRRQRKRSRMARGLCVVCGYDLRATPGRCPECGAQDSSAS